MTSEEKDQIEQIPFAVTFSCVDMIVYYPKRDTIIFIKKGKDDMFRIPGGMIDPTDLTNVEAAYRELSEEVNLTKRDIGNPVKIAEYLVGDKGRYDRKCSKHRLKSYLYSFEMNDFGPLHLEAGDDAAEVHEVAVERLYDLGWVTENILPTHIPMIFTWLAKQKRIY